MAATSLEIGLDRPTFLQCSSALRNLEVSRAFAIAAVGAFPLATSLPTHLQLSGLRLLLHVGRACSRPEAVDDPSRLYALLKYATSFGAGTSLLLAGGRSGRTMPLARDIQTLDSHKKTVLSDDLGCGIAFAFAGQVLNTVHYLDVETAIRRGWLTTVAPRSRRPDYISARLFHSQPWVVLEAKGTQSGDPYCRDQIESGCDQLSKVSLTVTPPTVPLLVAVGAALYREGQRRTSRVFVGDPAPNNPDPYDFRIEPADAVVRSHYLRVATLTGDDLLASFLSVGDAGNQNDQALVKKSVDGREFVGSTVSFKFHDSSVTAFIGLDSLIRRKLLARNFRAIAEKYGDIPTQHEDGDVTTIEEDRIDSKSVKIARSSEWTFAEVETDGTVLALRREGPLAENP